jgi:hypothetical protein
VSETRRVPHRHRGCAARSVEDDTSGATSHPAKARTGHPGRARAIIAVIYHRLLYKENEVWVISFLC